MDDDVQRFIDNVDNERNNMLNNNSAASSDTDGAADGAPEPNTDEPTPPTGPTPPPPPPTGPTPPPPPPVDVESVVGISSAYGDAVDLKSKAEKPTAKESAPPKREKSKGGGSEKDIMAVFWNMILEAYGWCIDKSVDISLDFVEWVLYSKPNEAGKTQGESVLDKSNSQLKTYIKGVDDTNEHALKVYKEIEKNVSLIASGEPADWTVLAGLDTGRFDDMKRYAENELVPAFRLYQANPDDPGAMAYKNFKLIPEIFDKSSKKIKSLGVMAFQLSAIKILTDENADYMPDGFVSKFKELQKKMSSRTIDYTSVGAIADELLVIVPDADTFTDLRENLTKIKQKATATDKDGIKECIKAINEDTTSSDGKDKYLNYKIASNAKVYLDTILENIDKIYEGCGTDVARRRETIKNYCESINDAIKSVAPVAMDVDEDVRSKIKASDKNRGALQKTLDSVNVFEFDGRPISRHATPTRQSQNIYENKNIIYDYMVGQI